MNRRQFVAGIGATVAAGYAGCLDTVTDSVEESFENSYDVSGETTLVVDNQNGSVDINDTDEEQVTVAGTKEASSGDALDDIKVAVTQDEQFRVEVSVPSGSFFERREVDLTVDIPARVTVDTVQTENGDVTVSGVDGDLQATTSNGDIDVTNVDGIVDCETTNGDIDTGDTTGLAGAVTTNGDIDVELFELDGDVTCESTNGAVTVRVGPDVAGGFELETSLGDASVETVEHTTTESGVDSLEGQLRDGDDPTLTLTSTNGDVTIRPVEE
jgi:DUF4097 and DUF4098 domain-containing protein YvlB